MKMNWTYKNCEIANRKTKFFYLATQYRENSKAIFLLLEQK